MAYHIFKSNYSNRRLQKATIIYLLTWSGFEAAKTPPYKGYLLTWSGFEAAKTVHGRVSHYTIVVNSLCPQMSELVEDAIAS